LEKIIEAKKEVNMTKQERINEMIAEVMLDVVIEYFPIVHSIEQVEFEKYCQIMDSVTCEDCSQKREGHCAGKRLDSMDSIMQKCLIPKVIRQNIKRIAENN